MTLIRNNRKAAHDKLGRQKKRHKQRYMNPRVMNKHRNLDKFGVILSQDNLRVKLPPFGSDGREICLCFHTTGGCWLVFHISNAPITVHGKADPFLFIELYRRNL